MIVEGTFEISKGPKVQPVRAVQVKVLVAELPDNP